MADPVPDKIICLKRGQFHTVDSPATIFGRPDIKLLRSKPSRFNNVPGVTFLPCPFNPETALLPLLGYEPATEPFKPRIGVIAKVCDGIDRESVHLQLYEDEAYLRADLPGLTIGMVNTSVEEKEGTAVLEVVVHGVGENGEEKNYYSMIGLPLPQGYVLNFDELHRKARNGVLQVLIPRMRD